MDLLRTTLVLLSLSAVLLLAAIGGVTYQMFRKNHWERLVSSSVVLLLVIPIILTTGSIYRGMLTLQSRNSVQVIRCEPEGPGIHRGNPGYVSPGDGGAFARERMGDSGLPRLDRDEPKYNKNDKKEIRGLDGKTKDNCVGSGNIPPKRQWGLHYLRLIGGRRETGQNL